MSEPTWTAVPDAAVTLEENWLFRLRRERFRSRASGNTHDYYVLHLADAVNVVALTPDRQVILVEQFRAGSGRDSLETPGGLFNPGEDPLEAGARELLEETGYAGDPPRHLTTVWSLPSLATSRVATILITNARRVAEPRPDENEELRVIGVSSWRVLRMIGEGQIDHALVVQSLLTWLVSELPGNPLCMPTAPLWRRQYRISSVMMLVAASAVVFGAIANLGIEMAKALAITVAFQIAVVIVYSVLDPSPGPVLLRSLRTTYRRRSLRFLALVGLLTLGYLPVLLLRMLR